jgi:radical SAM protein with 4Fe4S-binding SPASM domain
MCTIADWNRKDGVMKDALFEKIAAEIQEHVGEVTRVHLYRDGEPLLDKKLPQRIKRMKDAGVKKVGISTNVELLGEEKATAIMLAGLDEIILSIDGTTEEVHDKIRVGLDFEKVVHNARKFFYLRDMMGSKCQIRVRMVGQELNLHQWPDYQREWGKYVSKHDTIELHHLHNWGGQLKGFKSQGDTERPCIALWSLMCIFADGSVPMCNVDYNKKYPLGNVKDSSIAELWQSHTQNSRRIVHLDHGRKDIDLCANCTVWSERRDNPSSAGLG